MLLKHKISCLFRERLKMELTLCPLISKRSQWRSLCNRNEKLLQNEDGLSFDCEWEESSFLSAAKAFPNLGGRFLNYLRNHYQSIGESQEGLSVIFPVGGKDRIPQFKEVLGCFQNQTHKKIELIVVEHSLEPDYREACPASVKYHHIKMEVDAEFNKAILMNFAALQALHSNLLFHDADIVVPKTYAHELSFILKSFEAVRPIRFLFYLSQEMSKHNWSSVRGPVNEIKQNFPGGSTAIRKESYWALGGHDESFLGWGGEDLEFLERLKTLKGYYNGAYSYALHLWHPASPKKETGNKNLSMLDKKRNVDPAERIKYNQKNNRFTPLKHHD